MKLLLLLTLFQYPSEMTIRCDVDGRIETIGGLWEGPVSNNLLECPAKHNICSRHVKFFKHRVMCPIDGWHK